MLDNERVNDTLPQGSIKATCYIAQYVKFIHDFVDTLSNSAASIVLFTDSVTIVHLSLLFIDHSILIFTTFYALNITSRSVLTPCCIYCSITLSMLDYERVNDSLPQGTIKATCYTLLSQYVKFIHGFVDILSNAVASLE